MSDPLTFLGLAERAGKLIVGSDACGISVRAGKARVILLASDASKNSEAKSKNYAEGSKAPVISLPYTKAEVGSVIGHGAPGMMVITDIGMASGFISKLQEAFPEKYSDVSAELERRADKAAQRRKEAHRHEENIKHGKKKNKQSPHA